MSNITCPACGGQKATQINAQEYRCEYCGLTFAPAMPNVAGAPQQYAPQSGFQQAPQQQPAFNSNAASEKNRIAAGILAIFLGWFGVHHFYLGNTGRAIVYLFFFWTYIPAIIGLIEGIGYLTQSDAEFASKFH